MAIFSSLVMVYIRQYNHLTTVQEGIVMDNNFLQLISEQNQLKSVKKTNEYTNQYGLSLSDCDVHELMNRRREALVRQQRIEFGGGILEKIIHAFCDSCYIYQDIYAETIARLQDIFYYYKNESMDQLQTYIQCRT